MIRIILALLITSTAMAGLPPTTTKGSGDSTPVVTFRIDSPNIPITHSGVTATIGTVPVAGGGTGLTTLTANNVILGNGTSTPSFVAPGSNGNILVSNGSTWTSGANSPTSFKMWKTGYFATTGSCTWSRTNTALGSFTTTAACPGPTVEFDSGSGTLQTTDSDLPKVTVNSVPAGFCKASFTALAQGSTTNYRCFAITDGTTTSGRQCAAGTNAVVFPMSVTGHFSYGSSGNKSFELVNSSDTGSTTVDNATSNAQVYFSISCW